MTAWAWIRRIWAFFLLAAAGILSVYQFDPNIEEGALGFNEENFFVIIIVAAAAVTGVLLLMPDILRPISWMIDGILGVGGGSGGKPPFDDRVAQFHLREGNWEKAYAEYLGQQSIHPQQIVCYEELIMLEVQLGSGINAVRKWEREGLRHADVPEEKERIHAAVERALGYLRNLGQQAPADEAAYVAAEEGGESMEQVGVQESADIAAAQESIQESSILRSEVFPVPNAPPAAPIPPVPAQPVPPVPPQPPRDDK